MMKKMTVILMLTANIIGGLYFSASQITPPNTLFQSNKYAKCEMRNTTYVPHNIAIPDFRVNSYNWQTDILVGTEQSPAYMAVISSQGYKLHLQSNAQLHSTAISCSGQSNCCIPDNKSIRSLFYPTFQMTSCNKSRISLGNSPLAANIQEPFQESATIFAAPPPPQDPQEQLPLPDGNVLLVLLAVLYSIKKQKM